jgi:spore coat protein U-like protein
MVLAAEAALADQCNVTATPVNFGFYDPLSPVPRDATGTISVTCQTPARFPQTVTLQLSAGGSGAFGQRAMTSGTGDALLYNLFTDPSMATVFGDGSGGSTPLTNAVHRTAPWSVTIYGRMPPRQQVPVGTYSDILTATILW